MVACSLSPQQTGTPGGDGCALRLCSQHKQFTRPQQSLSHNNRQNNNCLTMHACALQVLFQVPLLRTFYLGEGHDPSSCQRALRDKPCVSCQMVGRLATPLAACRRLHSAS